MIDKINQMKKELEELMKTHDLNDQVILEASHQLDKLILEYHYTEYEDLKINFNDKSHRKELSIGKKIQ